ncbi:MAG: histidine kinase [Ignavibacteria bacterium]|nr:histidine kinase [Ignavibacteria bacterium]
MEKKTLIKLHLLFWIVSSSISIFDAYLYNIETYSAHRFITVSIRIILNIFTFYSFYFLVSPRYFNKKGFIFLVIFEIVYLIIFGFIYTFLTYLPAACIKSAANPIEYTLANGIKDRIFAVTAYIAIVSVLGILSKVSLIWYRNQIKQKEREKQNLSNELAMLRAQINPHFLFNTLNNIKSLTKSLPSKAINSVDKLMSIMHYMLYESSFETVSLSNEISHINNYLDLEKIRYTDTGFIDFEITGDYSGVYIPPLIFMPFIENAFKHGDKMVKAPGIIIKLDIRNKDIRFEIKNYVKENYETHNKNSGFGLANIRRRLDLLFDKKYELAIKNENKTYSVKLNLIIP